MQNNSYPSTYVTSVNNTASANDQLNYNSLFTFESGKIKSVARGTYFTGTSGNISFNNNGTEYNFSVSNNGLHQISSRNNWTTTTLSQDENRNVTMSNQNRNNTWQIYPVTLDIP